MRCMTISLRVAESWRRAGKKPRFPALKFALFCHRPRRENRMGHDPALDAHEHTEHAQHAAHAGDPYISRVAISVALLAAAARHEDRHHWLTGAATLFEIGIAMSTVAIITKRRWLWLAANGFGIVGLALLGTTYAM